MGNDIIFYLNFTQLSLSPLSDQEFLFILNLLRDDPYISLSDFKEILFDENPELYNKLIKFNLID